MLVSLSLNSQRLFAEADAEDLSQRVDIGKHNFRQHEVQAFALLPVALASSGIGGELSYFIHDRSRIGISVVKSTGNGRGRCNAFSLTSRTSQWLYYKFFAALRFDQHFISLAWTELQSGNRDWIHFRRNGILLTASSDLVSDSGFSIGIDWIGYNILIWSHLHLGEEYTVASTKGETREQVSEIRADRRDFDRRLDLSPFAFFTFKLGWTF